MVLGVIANALVDVAIACDLVGYLTTFQMSSRAVSHLQSWLAARSRPPRSQMTRLSRREASCKLRAARLLLLAVFLDRHV